jgi:hypothetical protein
MTTPRSTAADERTAEKHMAGREKPDNVPKDDGKQKPPPPLPADDEEYEDGDFATPKKDRYGTDDEPLE